MLSRETNSMKYLFENLFIINVKMYIQCVFIFCISKLKGSLKSKIKVSEYSVMIHGTWTFPTVC